MLIAVSLDRMVERDLNLCVWFNRACQYQTIKKLFALISWLGDGKFWYSLMLILPFVYGSDGVITSLKLATVGISGLIVYKLIKASTHRLRPFMVHQAINLGTAPLDQYSFPSGHTLHAVSFTIIIISHFPELAWLLVPITTLVALSRVVLGLHYPSDVAMGALIGAILAFISLYF